MLKNTRAIIVSVALAAMCVGPTACGNTANNKTTATETKSSVTATSQKSGSATASSSSKDAISLSKNGLYLEGKLADGSIVDYYEDEFDGTVTALAITKADYSDVKAWLGTSIWLGDDTVAIIDFASGNSINYKIIDIGADGSFKANLDGYGEVEVKVISDAEFQKSLTAGGNDVSKEIENELKDLEKHANEALTAMATELTQAATAFEQMNDNDVLYWQGELPKGSTVYYAGDNQSGNGLLSFISKNGESIVTWYGPVTVAEDGKSASIVDLVTGNTVSVKEISSTETESTIEIDGYGQATLKTVNKGEFLKYLDDTSKDIENYLTKVFK